MVLMKTVLTIGQWYQSKVVCYLCTQNNHIVLSGINKEVSVAKRWLHNWIGHLFHGSNQTAHGLSKHGRKIWILLQVYYLNPYLYSYIYL